MRQRAAQIRHHQECPQTSRTPEDERKQQRWAATRRLGNFRACFAKFLSMPISVRVIRGVSNTPAFLLPKSASKQEERICNREIGHSVFGNIFRPIRALSYEVFSVCSADALLYWTPSPLSL
jgi:hypothetical protein